MSANQIREKLASCLADEIPIEEFEDWIARETWNIHQKADDEAMELAYVIEAKLAEYSGGHMDEQALRSALSPLVTSYLPKPAAWSSNVTVHVPFPFSVASAVDAKSSAELAS